VRVVIWSAQYTYMTVEGTIHSFTESQNEQHALQVTGDALKPNVFVFRQLCSLFIAIADEQHLACNTV
jgi:hypothetical protein